MQRPNRGPHPPSAYDLRNRKKANWDGFAANLEHVLNTSMPTYTKPFGRVAVLFISWQNDDLGVKPLNDRLQTVFKKAYNYACESFVIPHNNQAQGVLLDRLIKFQRDWDRPDSLTIYFYGGHSDPLDTNIAPAEWMWYGSDNAKYSVDWFSIRGFSNSAVGKVLYLFDTCYSGTGAAYHGPELLASSSWESVAPEVHRKTLTWHLIEELERLNGDAHTVAQISANITRNVLHSNLEAMPVHVAKSGEPSIILARLGGRPTKRSDFGRQRPQSASEYRVMIAVTVEETVQPPVLASWKKWLTTNMPSGLLSTQVSIEGVFQGNSTVLLLTLPLEMWSCLDSTDDTIRFISHVRSNNLVLTQAGLQAMGLAPSQGGQSSKPPPPPAGGRENLPLIGGRENIPPHSRP